MPLGINILHQQVEGYRHLGIGGVNGDGELILGHDTGIVKALRATQIYLLAILQIGHITTATTRGEQHTHDKQHQHQTSTNRPAAATATVALRLEECGAVGYHLVDGAPIGQRAQAAIVDKHIYIQLT